MHRRKTREKHLKRAVLTGILARMSAFLPSLGIAPIASNHLGIELFGVLMTVLSFQALVNLVDLGVGASAVTNVSRAWGSGDVERVRQIQTNSLFITFVMSVLLLLTSGLVLYLNMGSFLFPKNGAPVQAVASQALAAFVFMLALSLPLNLIMKVQAGQQKADIANYWMAGAGILNFSCGVLACINDLPVHHVVLSLSVGTVVCGVMNASIHFKLSDKLAPRMIDLNRAMITFILKDSSRYLLLQLIFIGTFAADATIIARHLGANDVAGYALADRMFSIVTVAMAIITTPLWAAYGDAIGSGDRAWIKNILTTSIIRIALASSILSVSIYFTIDPAFALMNIDTPLVSKVTLMGMIIYRILDSIGNAIGAYLFASNNIGFVLATGALTATSSIATKIALIPMYGVTALPWSTALNLLCLSMIPCLTFLKLKINRI